MEEVCIVLQNPKMSIMEVKDFKNNKKIQPQKKAQAKNSNKKVAECKEKEDSKA